MTKDFGSSAFELTIRKSVKAKYVRIRISHKLGVELVVPMYVSESKALRFLETKKVWIINHLARLQIRKANNTFMLFGVPSEPVSKLQQKRMLLSYLAESCKRYAAMLGVSYNKIAVKETNNQWGSCSAKGNLSFALRLIKFEKEVIDYVVAHEVSHLIVKDHSKRFWKTVESICPNYKALRKSLR